MEFRQLKNGKALAEWVKGLRGKSGVYIIRERGWLGNVLYVGESHTGRLYSTLIRHFQHWKGPTAGPTFPVASVEIAVIRTPAAKAVDTQNAIIAEYRPELNTIAKPKGLLETIFGG
jgi:hypothetical protein